MKPNSQSGFTLLELMVAMVIFALLMTVSHQLLKDSINSKEILESKSNDISEIQKAVRIMQDDFSQLTLREIRNGRGEKENAILLNEGIYLVVFSRNGWGNPLAVKRSDLQRVAYALKDGNLIRYYWPVLDRAQDFAPEGRVLAQNIVSASVNFEYEKNNENSEVRFPISVKINLEHKIYGPITQIIAISSYIPSPKNEEEPNAEQEQQQPPEQEPDLNPNPDEGATNEE